MCGFQVELKPGGLDIAVTDENKDEYLELKANYVSAALVAMLAVLSPVGRV